MPITITLPPPGGVLAPWSRIGFSSSFIGPLPSGSAFVGQLYATPEPTLLSVAYDFRVPTTVTQGHVTLGIPAQGEGFSIHTDAILKEGADAHLTVELQQPGSVVIDSGTITGTWQPTTQILNQPRQTTGGGGLTSEQALQLSETHASTALSQLVDNLTLVSIGTAPPGGFVGSALPDTVFGVIVRITEVPPELLPNTPDGDYWVPSLAVVRIFRGTDLWKRIPIHTSTKIVGLLDESIVAAVAVATATLWLLNMSVQVSFRAGVAGQVFLMRFP